MVFYGNQTIYIHVLSLCSSRINRNRFLKCTKFYFKVRNNKTKLFESIRARQYLARNRLEKCMKLLNE